ncbi:hypothetical protein ACH4E9_36980 [Streptomyces anulatus]
MDTVEIKTSIPLRAASELIRDGFEDADQDSGLRIPHVPDTLYESGGGYV